MSDFSTFDPFMLQLGQMFALRPTLQSLGITQTLLDQHYQGVLERYAENLIAFFTGADSRRLSRWRHLAQRLEQRVRVARRELDQVSARAIVQSVLDYPDSGEREQILGERAPQVYLVNQHDCVALAFTRVDDPPLVFTLARGFETLDDVTALLANAECLAHDVFEGWALGALEWALQRIAWIDPDQFPTLASLERELAWASNLSDFIESPVEHHTLRFELEQLLPEWLRNASPSGRLAYSQWLESLARLHEKNRGVSVLDDLQAEGGANLSVDTQDGVDRHALFAQQLALQLRRLALEYSLQGKGGVTHEGYRILRAAVNAVASQRRLHGISMVFRPLSEGNGYAVGPLADHVGPWLVLRPSATQLIEQVAVVPNAGAPLTDPFMAFYLTGVALWAPVFEHPLHAVVRLKQLGGNLRGACELAHSWRCEVSLLRNLALLLVCPGTLHPGDIAAHPRMKRLDSTWAGAGQDLSVAQQVRLRRLRRSPALAQGQLITHGVHKGLYALNDLLIYNRDDNHFNVLSHNRIAPVFNINIVEQVVDNHEQPTQHGPRIARDASGRWQLERAPRLRRDTAQLSPAARQANNNGNALIASLPVLLSAADRQSTVPGALPVEVEESLQGNALAFENAARAVQRSNNNAPLISQLQSQALQLRAHGRYLRIEMTRHKPTPTLGDVKYLLECKAIRIRRVGGRVAETIDGVVDYLQEYEVLDLTEGNRPLWYAHFHYVSLAVADDKPTAAHLKTAPQRRLGREYERETGRTVYRAAITNAEGRQMFLGAPAD